ncbi:alanyl-tRNA editing protein [Alicyclobacillus ferrooxydans]|uniref:alanyl-tRNA editing protein n=1 Tax=Alicyclobacillus ferrooxydans TaxID=471514 RepID=UPI0006D55F21|nr:alanyl-tRNA editing protein [Alicyclobacillus ferrooxydans]
MGIQEERLYYHDSYVREFTSIVNEVRQTDAGNWVRLAETAFYPTSGGQPHDVGYLNGIRVTDVEAEDDGVWHKVDKPISVGQEVTGRIDNERRFDFMQQHSGQHVLSACFEQLLHADTVSFHMGDAISTIDIDVPQISDDDLASMERAANEWIWRDVPVQARFVTAEELAGLDLRKPPKVDEDVRIVTIVGLEHNPCGGTHVSSTGQIGQILITKTERMRGGVRINFVCGTRALAYSRQLAETFRTLGSRLSVGLPDMVSAVDMLQGQVRDGARQLQDLKQQTASLMAKDLVLQAKAGYGDMHALAADIGDGYGMNELKPMMSAVTALLEESGQVPYIAALTGTSAGRHFVLATVSEESSLQANKIVTEALGVVGGKGGGNAKMAQGSAPVTEGGIPLVEVLQNVMISLARP